MATTGWLGEQTVFQINSGQYYSWIASNVYISSSTHSGSNVTVSGTIKLYIRCNWSTSNPVAYYGDPITVTPRGGSAILIKDWTSTSSMDFYKDQEIGSVDFTTTYTESASTTSSTFSVYYKDTRRDDWVNTTLSWSTSIDPGYTAPTGLSASNVVPYTDGFSATVSVTGWGGTGDATTRVRSLNVRTYDASALITPRIYYQEYGNSTSSTITTTNSSNTGGDLTVVSNTRYTLSCYASNGTLDAAAVRIGDYVTLAKSPTVTVGTVTYNSAVVNYSTEADGGFYDKIIEYSIDGGITWTTGATVTGGSAQSGSFTITGLPSDTSNSVQIRTRTTSGSDSATTVTIQTEPKPVAFYGSVGEYVNDFTPRISDENNIIASFDKSVFLAKMWSDNLDKLERSYITGKDLQVLVGQVSGFIQAQLYIYDPDTQTGELIGRRTSNTEEYGFTLNSGYSLGQVAYVDLDNPTYTGATKEVKKLYGSIPYMTNVGSWVVNRISGYNLSCISALNTTTFMGKINSDSRFRNNLLNVKATGITVDYEITATTSSNFTASVKIYAQSSGLVASISVRATSLAGANAVITEWGGVVTSDSSYPRGSRVTISNPTYTNLSKKILKLYGSENGSSVLVYRDES